jgi:hypothetical protein
MMLGLSYAVPNTRRLEDKPSKCWTKDWSATACLSNDNNGAVMQRCFVSNSS